MNEAQILAVLDDACRAYTFPMLDNGYIYLAATRLSLFRSEQDWAMVIEVFGFSPREGIPSTYILTFASRLHQRNARDNYVSAEAYENYLKHNPCNESRLAGPIDDGDWIDPENGEAVAAWGQVRLRNQNLPLPSVQDYLDVGIILREERPAIFELCRYLAAKWRNDVLATPTEQRISILPEMTKLLQLEEWHHPNVVSDELPSQNETFQQLARVLVTGNASLYRPSLPPNTHWLHWSEGGTL